MTKCLALIALISGCTTAEPSHAPDEPLATVELASGAVVTFYETSPGALAVSEDYAIGEEPVASMGRSAVEVFQEIAPGRAVPEALAAAQARNVEARASRVHAAVPPPRENYIDNTTIDDKWFADNLCVGSWDNIWCRLNQTTELGNNTPMKDHDTDEFYGEVCADRGQGDQWANVDDTVHTWTVIQGHCHYYHWTSGWLNVFSAEGVTDLFNNARYHVSMRTRH